MVEEVRKNLEQDKARGPSTGNICTTNFQSSATLVERFKKLKLVHAAGKLARPR
jgi:hypothetical protein